MMANYSLNSSIKKSISSKGTSTKPRTSNDSADTEESGWTAYFEDYDQANSHFSSSFSCSVSLISGAAKTSAGVCSSTIDTSLKVPRKLRTKEIRGDDSLEDTATSPVNSPKGKETSSKAGCVVPSTMLVINLGSLFYFL